MIAVVTSMEREVSGLLRWTRETYAGTAPPERLVLVHVIGVGRERALDGMKVLLDRSARPDAILSVGFGGALSDELATGDLVVSRRLYVEGEGTFFESDPCLMELAREVLDGPGRPRYFVADALTVPHVVTAAEKARLASATPGWVASMEDYWIGKAAAAHGIAFLSVRAVLDTASQELPAFVAELGNKMPIGQVLRLVANVILRPQDLPRIVKLSKQAKVAQDSLAAFSLPFVSRMTTVSSYAQL